MLNLRTYLVKERVGWGRLTDVYDIYDAMTNEKVGEAIEEIPGWSKFARLLINKKLLPTTLAFYAEGSDEAVLSIRRGVAILRTKVTVENAEGQMIGYFKSKLFTLGGGFYVYYPDDSQFADVKGDWKGWNFKFHTDDGRVLGTVTKKWAGFGKEFFTSADNYVVALEEGAHGTDASALMLAAGLAIDTVFKEGN